MRPNIKFNSNDRRAEVARILLSGVRFLTHNPSTFERIVEASWARAASAQISIWRPIWITVARQLEIVADPLRVAADRGEQRLLSVRRVSRRDGHLQHAILLMAEQLISLLDLIELEPMRNERSQVDTSRGDRRHKPPHALLASWTKRRDDRKIGKTGAEGTQRYGEIGRVDPET